MSCAQLSRFCLKPSAGAQLRAFAASNPLHDLQSSGSENLRSQQIFEALAKLELTKRRPMSAALHTRGTAPAASMAEDSNKVDLSIPTSVWSEESRQVYGDLEAELSKQPGWVKKPFLVDVNDPVGEPRLLTRCDREQTGHFFNYAFFVNLEEEKLRGVIEFGPYLQGPPSCAHGGASATIADACMGSLIYHTGRRAVTANLSVDYKNLVQLGRPYYIESAVDREEGRKVFSSFRMKSTEDNSLCVKSTALFIMAAAREKAERPVAKETEKTDSADYVFAEKSSDPKL